MPTPHPTPRQEPSPPYGRGDFVWTRYPMGEGDVKPGSFPHVCYVQDVVRSGNQHYLLVVYTTSQPPAPNKPLPRGSIVVDGRQAIELGHSRGFRIDSRFLGLLPMNQEWFPDIPEGRRGTKAPRHLRDRIDGEIRALAQACPDSIRMAKPTSVSISR